MAKKLDDIPKKDIFQAPEGYFEGLEGKIGRRIDAAPEARVVSFFEEHRLKLVGLAVAASVALLIVFFPSGKQSGSQDVNAMIEEISVEDCLAYLEYSDLTIEQIIGSATDEELEEALGDFVPEPEFEDEDLDLLYEKFGATADEKLQTL